MKFKKQMIAALTVTALSAVPTYADAIPDTLDSLAGQLRMISLYDTNGWGSVPPEWTLMQRIDLIATDNQLIEIASGHSNPAARATAFTLLLDRGNPQTAVILENSLTDRTKIAVRAADVIYGSTVADFEVQAVESARGNGADLCFIDSRKVDSLIFHTPGMTHIQRLNAIIDTLPQTEANYARLHQLVHDEDYPPALKALAKYHRNADRKIIKRLSLNIPRDLTSNM